MQQPVSFPANSEPIDEQQRKFFEGPHLQPLPAGSPLATHTYQIPKNRHCDITLRVTNSHSPDPSVRALFFAPCAIQGEVVFEAKKPEGLRSVVVSVRGRDVGSGYAQEWQGQGVPGQPGKFAEPFWESASPNVLGDSVGATSTIQGTETLPFSIDIPAMYRPKSPPAKVPMKKRVETLLHGHLHAEAEAPDEQDAPSVKDFATAESEKPLPPSHLRHEDLGMREDGQIVAEYTLCISVTTASKLDPDIFLQEPVFILPLVEGGDDAKSESVDFKEAQR